MSTDEITQVINEAGFDTPEKFLAFLRPAGISAELAVYDGRIVALHEKRSEVMGELQEQEEALIREREEVRRKLQGEK